MQMAGLDIPDSLAERGGWYFRHWFFGNRARRHITERRSREVLQFLPERSGASRLLDLGSGPGLLSLLAARQGFKVTAVDVDPVKLQTTRIIASGNGIELDLVCCDAAAFLASARTRFDVAVSMELIEHLPDWRVVVERLALAVVPGGFIVLSTPNNIGLSCLLRRVVQSVGLYPYTAGYERFLSMKEIADALAASRLTQGGLKRVLFTPPFLPDALAAGLPLIEKAAERIPILNRLATTTILRARLPAGPQPVAGPRI